MELGNSGEAVLGIIGRLQQLLIEENDVLAGHTVRPHAAFAEGKNHALREFMTIGRRGVSSPSRGAVTGQLVALRKSLAANEQLLDLHIKALREVAAVIVDCIQVSESDGTYGLQRRTGRPPQC